MQNSTKTYGSRLYLKFLKLSGIILFSLISNTYAINVYYVATTGNDINSGGSASPFRTLQKGVDVAVGGDTIIVRDGVYGPEGADSFSMPVNINKAGMASAWITLRAENKWGAILDCQLTAHSYINFQANSAYWKIQDFEIRNGYSAGIWANSGGAKNIIISGNHIHHIGNRVSITEYGLVGIYTDAGAQNFTVEGNVINDVGRTNTYTNSFDHGIYSHGNLNIINNVFYKSRNGWHIQTAANFSGTIANNTFYGPNMFTGYAQFGQIMLWDAASGSVTIRNNIFYNSYGTAITSYAFSQASGICSCDNNIIYGSGVTVGAPSPCVVNNNHLNTDPLFVNPPAYDFHLQAGSPAIDKGVPVSMVDKDFDGILRPQCAAYDIGAFEYNCGTPPPPPPSVSITSPTNGASYTPSANIMINASASEVDSTVFKVEFYNGDTLIGTDFSSPYSWLWTNVPEGSYSLTAKAYYNGGKISTSTAILIFVNCGPPDNFVNTSFVAQTGLFTSEFDVTPTGNKLNGVIGLSNGAAVGYSDLACIIRFNDAGFIDARNGIDYFFTSIIPYSAAISYHVKMLINLSTKKYDIYVTPQGGNEMIVGLQYDFRTDQNGVTQLNNYCKATVSCNLTITNFTNTAVACESTDKTPPIIPGFTVTPTSLWPPDHTMHDIQLFYTPTDNCSKGSSISCVVGVTSNEPINGTGDGDSTPDWVIVNNQLVQLRAERSGSGIGRIYTLTIACTDAAGNVTNKTATVTIVHDKDSGFGTPGKLSVKALPNPTSYYFNLELKSASSEKLTITILDFTGRIIEKRTDVPANSTLQIGDKYYPGIYIAEVIQGRERIVLRLTKEGK